MKITPEQIARVAEIKEGLAEKTWLFLRPGCHWSFHDMSWKKLKAGSGVDKLHIESCYKFADSLLRTIFKDVPVGGELLTEYKRKDYVTTIWAGINDDATEEVWDIDGLLQAQHDVDSVTIGQVLEGK